MLCQCTIKLTNSIIFVTISPVMLEIKIPKVSTEAITETAQRVGFFIMAATMTLSMLDSPNEAKRIVLPNQPALGWIGQSENGSNQIRREREETAPHFISYSVVQRTPARSGRG